MIHLIENVQAGVITDAPRVVNVGLNVLNFLLSIFGIIAILMLVVSGVRYVVSFGDVNQKEEAKKGAKSALVGVVVVMGSMVVIKFVGMFLK